MGLSSKQTTLILDTLAGLFTIAGLVGLIISCVELVNLNAKVYNPWFLTIWLTLFMLFYGLQIPWNLHLAPLRGSKTALANFIHYMFILVVVFILFVAYYVGYRNDGGSWSLFLIPCIAINAYIAYCRYNLVSKENVQENVQSDEEAAFSDKLLSLETVGLSEDLYFRPKNKTQRTTLVAFAGLNAFLVSISFILIGLLLGGSTLQAHGYRSYPPRGNFYSITYSSGQNQEIMAYCVGAFNASRPTIVFDIGGGGHSSSDLYGLQEALNEQGYRVCTYDYPGCGWSGYAVSNAPSMILDKVLEALNESPPYVLLGTMDGGPERIYEYALAYPQNVKAIIPIDYRPGPTEMEAYKMIRNYTDSQASNYALTTISSRYQLGSIISGIAVQWGLITLFAPPGDTYVPADRQREKLFLNLYNEKQWHTQSIYLLRQIKNISLALGYDTWFTNTQLDAGIPVYWFYNNVNNTRICIEYRYTPIQCQESNEMAQISYKYVQLATNRTAGSKIIQYEDATDMLSQGQYIPWTAQQIVQTIET